MKNMKLILKAYCPIQIKITTSERGTGLFLWAVCMLTVLPPTWVDPAGSPANLGGELASTKLCLFTVAG